MSEADAELVTRTLQGDRSAYESLVAAHLPRLRAIARAAINDHALADDAVQEACIRAYDRLAQLRDGRTFPGWIGAIVRHEAIALARRQGYRRQVAIEHADAAPSADEEDGLERERERVRAALARLPPAQRELLALKYEAGLDYDQIAETLGLSVANVEKRLYRARQELARFLG